MLSSVPQSFGLRSSHWHKASRCAIALALLVVDVGTSQAQDQYGADETVPERNEEEVAPAIKEWEQGVTSEARQGALSLFQSGNGLFSKSEYRQAAEQYRQALALWNHPRVHGNLATALIHLDNPLEAIEHLEKALSYGAQPFESHVYEQLLTNKKLLLGQLVRLQVSSGQEGVEIIVDGTEQFVGPGSISVLTTAGNHQVVGRKEGHQSFTRELTAIGGKVEIVEVKLAPLVRVTRYKRKWAAWKPWAVVGAGALVGVVGLSFRRASLSAREQYLSEIDANCPCTTDEISPSIQDLEGRAVLYNRFEIGSYVVGGATLMAGAVLAYINRRHSVESEEASIIVAVPIVGAENWRVGIQALF